MKPKIIGLTGGIGSGKTTVAGFFAKRGVPVYIADDEAKKILMTPEVAEEIASVFGYGVLAPDGLPDRARLAAVVFEDPEKLKALNGIIHPKVSAQFRQWAERHQEAPFLIREAAILFESGSYKDCDKIILVTAPQQERIRRVVQRDNTTPDDVKRRMDNQWSDEEKLAKSDYVIINTEMQDTEKQVVELIKELQNI